MRGTTAKRIRKMAEAKGLNYSKLKKVYLSIKRNKGKPSVSRTPAAPGSLTSIETQKKFKGFRVSANRTCKQTFNPPHDLRPNAGWALHGIKSPMYRDHKSAQGRPVGGCANGIAK